MAVIWEVMEDMMQKKTVLISRIDHDAFSSHPV